MKVFLVLILTIHGLIHLMGFIKAFNLAPIEKLVKPISKPSGVFWLLSAILFVISAGLIFFKIDSWWIFAALGIPLSQILIFQGWSDAKFGTIANLIILIPVIVSGLNSLPTAYGNRYKTEVEKRLTPFTDTSVVSENDIRHLPAPVIKYLHFAGAVGKPKVHNFRAVFAGTMKRTMESSWMKISSQQYNFYDDPARLFYIDASLFGIPFDGLHLYLGEHATMEIKVAALFTVADARGPKMDQGETVTMFNDMCLLAPATLIDKNIQWECIDSAMVKGTFTNRGQTISATLLFNEKGELVNFVSFDRFHSLDGITYSNYPWSTPVRNYRDSGGRKVPNYGEAIWHMPQGSFSYARFDIIEIDYNLSEFK